MEKTVKCANCHIELPDAPNETDLKFMFALCGECQEIINGGNMKEQVKEFGKSNETSSF